MLSKCVRSNALRITAQAARMSAGVSRDKSVNEGGNKGLIGHNSPYFTNNMNLAGAASLVHNFDEIVRRAIAGDLKLANNVFDKREHASTVEYLETIAANVGNFAATGGIVGRQRERQAIKRYFQFKGMMAFICGGPSVGKTRLLNDIIKEEMQLRNAKGGADQAMPMSVVRFDGRAKDALLKALQQEALKMGVLCPGTVEVEFSGVKVKMPLTGSSEVGAVTDFVTALWQKTQKHNEHVVVVLDEADAFLRTTNKAADDTVKLFNTLILHTKQTCNMSVVFLSADEFLPFRLETDLGLNSAHTRETLVIGQAAPQEMLKQLEELEVGQNLRELLVRVYGGHIWQIDVALDTLAFAVKVGSKAKVVRGPMNFIESAIARWEEQKGDMGRLVSVLEEVARCGFCPLDKNDALARVLTKSHTCTFLSHGATEYFIDPEVRRGCSGVTPSTQLVRVLIPVVLQQREGRRRQ